MDNKDKTTTNSNTPTDPGLAQRQARRANLFLHVRVLLQYLTRVDPKLRVAAQNVSIITPVFRFCLADMHELYFK